MKGSEGGCVVSRYVYIQNVTPSYRVACMVRINFGVKGWTGITDAGLKVCLVREVADLHEEHEDAACQPPDVADNEGVNSDVHTSLRQLRTQGSDLSRQ